MSEDILHRFRASNPDAQFETSIFNKALILIEDICLAIANKTIIQLGLCAPIRSAVELYERDLQQQRTVYNTIINAIANKRGGLYFLDAPGETGKTFLISLLLASIRSKNQFVLAIASSGIAATLLDGSRTAHSALKLPLNRHVTETPTCNISRNSGMGKILKNCKLIIWDECTRSHEKALEALDRTLQDLRENSVPFGDALILLSGDFRQTLPVIPRSTPADELNAYLKSSVLWKKVKILSLKTNTRVQLQRDTSAEIFAQQLLDIENGTMVIDRSNQLIVLPPNFCTITSTKEKLITKVFPNIVLIYKNHKWLSEHTILAAKNNDVNTINYNILQEIPGVSTSYKSIDTVMNQDEIVNYPTEFLNSLDLPGMPPHDLTLKVGVPIILLGNINPPQLCNGTRLSVKKLMKNIIETTILNGKSKGTDVLLPRIPMIPTDMPFEFKRLQFPVLLAFAMTTNTAQGQPLQNQHLERFIDCSSSNLQ
ncbi:hypothetical protein TKK_0014709 [Trichogramma kaykai]